LGGSLFIFWRFYVVPRLRIAIRSASSHCHPLLVQRPRVFCLVIIFIIIIILLLYTFLLCAPAIIIANARLILYLNSWSIYILVLEGLYGIARLLVLPTSFMNNFLYLTSTLLCANCEKKFQGCCVVWSNQTLIIITCVGNSICVMRKLCLSYDRREINQDCDIEL
jgi:hypothetical protein